MSVPDQWSPDTDGINFPVFVKPDKGQGSQRARRIDSQPELKLACTAEPDLLVMEYLPGREWTVDCFSQHGKGVLYAHARARIQAKAGIATLTRPERLPFARDWAERIEKHLSLRGAWFFQVKENAPGQPRLLEVGPRIAGSMALNRVLGPNFPLLTLYEAAGHDIQVDTIDSDMPMGRSLDTRFICDKPIEALYIDLDDTLILRNEVNILLVALAFQCRNRSIPVHLISRHNGDINKTLERFRLTNIFDRIIHLRDKADVKANHISEKGAVLIDDSFSERHAVTQRLGIRCFDVAAAICLLDNRQ